MAVDRTSEFFALAASISGARHAGPTAVPASKGAAPGHSASRSAASVSSSSSTSITITRPTSRSGFMQAVHEVAGDIRTTSQKLQALARLVKRRGMFADQSEEIEVLTAAVKTDMSLLTSRLDALDDFIDGRRRQAQAKGLRAGDVANPAALAAASANGGAGSISVRGEGDGAVGSGSGNSSGDAVLSSVQGLTHSGLVVSQMRSVLLGFTGSLKGVLEARTQSMKSQAGRRQALGGVRDLGAPVAGLLPPSSSSSSAASTAGPPVGRSGSAVAIPVSPAVAMGGSGAPSTGAIGGSTGGRKGGRFGDVFGGDAMPVGASASASPFGTVTPGATASSLLGSSALLQGGGGTGTSTGNGYGDAFAPLSQQQVALMSPHMDEQSFLDARADEVQAVERHIVELGQMFTRLATVIQEQGALVDRIEDNVETARVDVDAGIGQLNIWRERVFDNKRLVMKIVAIIILAILAFVFFGT